MREGGGRGEGGVGGESKVHVKTTGLHCTLTNTWVVGLSPFPPPPFLTCQRIRETIQTRVSRYSIEPATHNSDVGGRRLPTDRGTRRGVHDCWHTAHTARTTCCSLFSAKKTGAVAQGKMGSNTPNQLLLTSK